MSHIHAATWQSHIWSTLKVCSTTILWRCEYRSHRLKIFIYICPVLWLIEHLACTKILTAIDIAIQTCQRFPKQLAYYKYCLHSKKYKNYWPSWLNNISFVFLFTAIFNLPRNVFKENLFSRYLFSKFIVL